MDILAANATSDAKGGIQIWLGDGRGNWPLESGPTKTGKFMDVAVADFNQVRADQWAAKYNCSAFQDYRKLLT